MNSFLLDTNILLGLIRRAPWAVSVSSKYTLEDPNSLVLTSIICRGEILALAEKRGWGKKKRERLETVFNEIPIVDINSDDVLEAYARIDAWTHSKPVAAPNNAPPPKQAKPMTQNDMWIAATTHAIDAKLVSGDNDFKHLDKIWFELIHVPTN